MADSRITVIGPQTKEKGISLLPSNQKIIHQTDKGIKLHIINSNQDKGRRDIIATVAGSVLLGLQSIIYLESTIEGMFGKITFEKIKEIIVRSITDFWEDAHDKEVEYLFNIADDQNRNRILSLTATSTSKPILHEIPSDHGVTIGVIGDQKERIRREIYSEITTILMLKADLEPAEAALISCLRAMRRETENPGNIFVGGPIQLAAMKGTKAYYMASNYKDFLSFRGAKFNSLIDIRMAPLKHMSWPIFEKVYDPNLPLEVALADI